ncbi:glycosyltransferase family 2 protein [Yoonia sp. BS5-3]|uniref:Glycosyltransferase family 2 protein n=1 Tax=Yoonia phaeophyticola TaxID=3137369 RepID=A0ABZ3IDV0_9RHOB
MRGPGDSYLSKLWFSYRLRWKRRRLLWRIWRKRHQITAVFDRTAQIADDAILCFATVRNEMLRLPYFLEHYRKLGVTQFLIVDNDSDDGTTAFLAAQPDVSLWTTAHSYKLARFGMDWLGWLQWQFGSGHWCLTVDADELLIYPDSDTRGLPALTDWLDARDITSFGALMLDMYPKGRLADVDYQPDQDPIETLSWFDADNYRHRQHPIFDNLWIQGGVRERVFFAGDPQKSPTLSKTPLVRWHWRHVYVSSTHQMLPRYLNHVFDKKTDRKVTGVLLHTKFLPNIGVKSAEEIDRAQHFENSAVYVDYHRALTENPVLWSPQSYLYKNAQQLIDLGLMSKGDWG